MQSLLCMQCFFYSQVTHRQQEGGKYDFSIFYCENFLFATAKRGVGREMENYLLSCKRMELCNMNF